MLLASGGIMTFLLYRLNNLSPPLLLMITISVLLISPATTLAFANATLSDVSNQILTSNNAVVIILEGATLIDGTGALPRHNTTIVINGTEIVYVSNNTSVNKL